MPEVVAYILLILVIVITAALITGIAWIGYKTLAYGLNTSRPFRKFVGLLLIMSGITVCAWVSYRLFIHYTTVPNEDFILLGTLYGFGLISLGIKLISNQTTWDYIGFNANYCLIFSVILLSFSVGMIGDCYYRVAVLHDGSLSILDIVELYIIYILTLNGFVYLKRSRMTKKYFAYQPKIEILEEINFSSRIYDTNISTEYTAYRGWDDMIKINNIEQASKPDARFFSYIPVVDAISNPIANSYPYYPCISMKLENHEPSDSCHAIQFDNGYFAVFTYEKSHAYLMQDIINILNFWFAYSNYSLRQNKIFVEYLNFEEWHFKGHEPKIKIYVPIR